jgi:hypothetical protein
MGLIDAPLKCCWVAPATTGMVLIVIWQVVSILLNLWMAAYSSGEA